MNASDVPAVDRLAPEQRRILVRALARAALEAALREVSDNATPPDDAHGPGQEKAA